MSRARVNARSASCQRDGVRVEGTQREVRQEAVGPAFGGAGQEGLRRGDVARFRGCDPRVHERLEVAGFHGQDLLEVARGLLEVASREVRLGEVEAELDVAAVQAVQLLERADPAVGVERQDRELRFAQATQEGGPVLAGVPRHDAVAPLEKTVLLLDGLHPGVHLGLPQVEDLLGPDRSGTLERLLQRQDARVRHEQVLLEIADRLEERLDGLARPLDHVLQGRDPFEQVLVERDLLLRLAGALVHDAHAGEDEELGVAAPAELLVVRVLRAAGLAIHERTLLPGRHPGNRLGQRTATERRGLPKRESIATPTATMDAALQRTAPTNGRSEMPPRTANPAASATGRLAGETFFRASARAGGKARPFQKPWLPRRGRPRRARSGSKAPPGAAQAPPRRRERARGP